MGPFSSHFLYYDYCCPLSLASLVYFFSVALFLRVLLLFVAWLFDFFAFVQLDRTHTFSSFIELNDEKCQLMVFGDKSTETTIKIGNSEIKESAYKKLLGITFDKKFNFKKYIEDLCRKADQKIHVLARLSSYNWKI